MIKNKRREEPKGVTGSESTEKGKREGEDRHEPPGPYYPELQEKKNLQGVSEAPCVPRLRDRSKERTEPNVAGSKKRDLHNCKVNEDPLLNSKKVVAKGKGQAVVPAQRLRRPKKVLLAPRVAGSEEKSKTNRKSGLINFQGRKTQRESPTRGSLKWELALVFLQKGRGLGETEKEEAIRRKKEIRAQS